MGTKLNYQSNPTAFLIPPTSITGGIPISTPSEKKTTKNPTQRFVALLSNPWRMPFPPIHNQNKYTAHNSFSSDFLRSRERLLSKISPRKPPGNEMCLCSVVRATSCRCQFGFLCAHISALSMCPGRESSHTERKQFRGWGGSTCSHSNEDISSPPASAEIPLYFYHFYR